VKPYQIAIIFFALGISFLTFFRDWLVEARVRVFVKPTPSVVFTDWDLGSSSLKLFFSNKIQDPNNLNCEVTYSVSREVSRPTNNSESRVGELTYILLKELLNGPTKVEKSQGFFTSINLGTKIQKISIVRGVATIEFSEELVKGVAGSCRVQAIRSQITETLKQFPEIREVVILVNGDFETILQP